LREGSGRISYQEMASDAELSNLLGQEVHRHLGYEEVERLVCFRKAL
jgi:aminoglycoside 6'-N-acetyltransferase I